VENMPVMKKEFELNNGTKIMVRQASGLEKLKLETRQAKVFRKLRHFGPNPSEWSEKQQEEFALALDEAGCGLESQMAEWIPKCVIDEFDVNTLTSEELRELLGFVRGDDLDGAIPLGN
tara:strand:+ start:3923 stop:4279 length:357 start_codon:yes stop_codon:yes gene_type:complete